MNGSGIDAFIGIGANLGNAQANVQRAILQLDKMPQSKLTAASSLFRTEPVDAQGNDYVNAVVHIVTTLTAAQLLLELQIIEQEFGRERLYHNAPRTLDLDILLFGKQTIDSESLVVPHPRLTERAFTLIPLLQLDPFIHIPGKGAAHMFVAAVAAQKIRKI